MNGNKRPVGSVIAILCVAAWWPPSAAVAQAEIQRGYYVFGHEVRTFQPCGTETVYWVKAEADVSKRLREEYRQLTTKPYEPVYVEVKGYFAERATGGFAADYDGQIVVESVDVVRATQENDCSSDAAAQEGITGIVWKWQQTRLGNGPTTVPDDPARYTVAFQPGGSLAIRADCNRVGGNYTIENTSLTIETTFSTRAMCPSDSLEQSFKKHLNAAASFFIQEGHLVIDLERNAGTMEFAK